ncbi:MAG: ankyrin repeat domain-containing protein [Rhodovibrionaceae bacterium]|nr:ankyrin repeat domain-containing protein [Rhodovibrionaceae bacterium]
MGAKDEKSGAKPVELAKTGDAEGLKARLQAGGPADSSDRLGVTALAHAARRGDLAAIELLLEHGADPDKTSDSGNSPLMEAAARGHADVVKRLLAAGADPKRKNKWGFDAQNWADWPVNGAEIRALLEQNEG